jgi:hypothetical protein
MERSARSHSSESSRRLSRVRWPFPVGVTWRISTRLCQPRAGGPNKKPPASSPSCLVSRKSSPVAASRQDRLNTTSAGEALERSCGVSRSGVVTRAGSRWVRIGLIVLGPRAAAPESPERHGARRDLPPARAARPTVLRGPGADEKTRPIWRRVPRIARRISALRERSPRRASSASCSVVVRST